MTNRRRLLFALLGYLTILTMLCGSLYALYQITHHGQPS
jgi:hypothetical protein